MADKTFGVKVSEELQERVQNMISNSNLTAKEWFEKAVALVEINELKEGSSDYKQDLNELEVHTTRIFELVTNMIQRANYLKQSETKGLVEKIEQKDTVIAEYQGKVNENQVYLQTLQEQMATFKHENQTLLEQLGETKLTNVNNQELIKEYKEKIDSMSGLVAKYQGFASENESLKEKFEKEKEQVISQLKEILGQIDDQQEEIKTYQQTIQSLKDAHKVEIERLEEKKSYEKDRELLNQEKAFQEQISTLNKEHNQEIKALYDEKDRLRKEFEEKIEKLQNQLAAANTANKKRSNNS
jgi:chromosome segregation ATPase